MSKRRGQPSHCPICGHDITVKLRGIAYHCLNYGERDPACSYHVPEIAQWIYEEMLGDEPADTCLEAKIYIPTAAQIGYIASWVFMEEDEEGQTFRELVDYYRQDMMQRIKNTQRRTKK